MTTNPPQKPPHTNTTNTVLRDDKTRVYIPVPHTVDKEIDVTIIKPKVNIQDDVTQILLNHNHVNTNEKNSTFTSDVTQTLNPLTNTQHSPYSSGGDVINKRFIIERVLGRGGMGIVCKVLDLRKVEADDQQPYVALKLLSKDFQEHANAFKSLQREAKKSQALAHPNIITVFDFDRDDDTIFMTMELLDGYPLDAIIKGKTDVVIDKKITVKIIREIALALEYAHSKGIIHSDLKPANIFYTKTGQTKVLDFGIARALGSDLYTDNFDAGDLNAMTPKYASLDMFKQKAPDPRDDIYALGLIAGELLCGHHPYKSQFATTVFNEKLKPNISKSVGYLYKQLIIHAVAINKDQRTQTASKFLSRLNWAQKGPKRVVISSLLIMALIICNSLLIQSVDTTIPLSSLPEATQTTVITNIKEADTALMFRDYNGALLYLDKAYSLHPSNSDIEERADQIINILKTNLSLTKDTEAKIFLLEQLKEIGNYAFISKNEHYNDLIKSIGLIKNTDRVKNL